jgi:hypothetical protein
MRENEERGATMEDPAAPRCVRSAVVVDGPSGVTVKIGNQVV